MTREEAIRRIKAWNLDSDDMEVLSAVVPELRESEDERIRKEIIDYLGLVGKGDGDYAQPMIDRWIAYLEKQKEQKPWKVGANAYFTPEQELVVTHGETYHVDTLGTQQVIAGKMPQKPAEWSEEDEEMLNSCISSIEEAKENRYAYKETDGDTSYDHEISWLKSLRPQPHWKPSEEQMCALRVTLEYMPDTFKPRCTLMTLQNDLKKLM